jgi:hypothetical protein
MMAFVEDSVRIVLERNQVHRFPACRQNGVARKLEQVSADASSLISRQDVDRVQLGVTLPLRLPGIPDVDEADDTPPRRFGDVHPVERRVEAPAEHRRAPFDREVAGLDRPARRAERLPPRLHVDFGGCKTVGNRRSAPGDGWSTDCAHR